MENGFDNAKMEAGLPAKMHSKKVQYQGEEVYRYLLCCKRCVNFVNQNRRGGGKCAVTGEGKMQQTLSCEAFKATPDGECMILLETARIDGTMIKVTIGDGVYYATHEEVDSILDLLDG